MNFCNVEFSVVSSAFQTTRKLQRRFDLSAFN